jgi:hypothetical protein
MSGETSASARNGVRVCRVVTKFSEHAGRRIEQTCHTAFSPTFLFRSGANTGMCSWSHKFPSNYLHPFSQYKYLLVYERVEVPEAGNEQVGR